MTVIETPDNTNSMKTLAGIGFALAILSLLLSFVPCIGAFGILGAVPALICCGIAYNALRKGSGQTGLATAGLIIGSIALLIGIGWATLLSGVNNEFEESFGPDFLDKIQEEAERVQREGGTIDDVFIDSLLNEGEPVDSFLYELDRIMEEEMEELDAMSDSIGG